MENTPIKDFYTVTDEDNIAWLHFDKQGSTTNVLSASVLEELYQALLELEKQKPRGLVILSDKKNGFIAGADVNEFTQLKNQNEALDAIRRGQGVFDRLAALPFSTVALIRGFCLGGGLELALACDYRIALNENDTRLGLPEVRLGIHPGFGGSARITPLIGATQAMDLMLSGRTVTAFSAQRMGLIDYALPERQLEAAARKIILEKVSKHKPTRAQRMSNHKAIRPVLAKVFQTQVAKKANKAHYPAPYSLIDIWKKHGDDERAMLQAEAESVARLLSGNTAQNLIRVFQLQEKMKGLAKLKNFRPTHVHVVGAGLMGGDIAAWCALKGLNVTLQDQSPERIAPALKRAHTLFKRRLKRDRPVQEVMDRLLPDHAGLGIKKADVVIEAIFENADAKRSLYAALEPEMKTDALLATNTSSIPLQELSSILKDPGRLVGLHFFNPVAKMQLVEIVQDTITSEQASQQAIAFAKRIGRLPLPVKSSPGFLVNRVLMPYLLEAIELVSEGVPAILIDEAATDFGMPMGPIELADTVGLDICLHVGNILGEHLGLEVPAKLGMMVDTKKLGRKSGEGFYQYKKGKPVKPKAPRGYQLNDDVSQRMIMRMLNEVVACYREQVVSDPDLIDGGLIFGTGFSPFLGGPMHYIETEGVDVMLRRLQDFERRYGPRFAADTGWKSILDFDQTASVGNG
ncbi:MAG: 3-hydroxyacyl-CoA dehydrogenase NAD-binding domain-containing protein [Gammaproteobacteria bacterium]